MKTNSKAVHPDIGWLDKKAQELRLEVARSISKTYGGQREHVDNYSHFSLYQDKLPLPSGRVAVQFNQLVTDTVLRKYVLTETNPYIVAFLGSKVIEQNFYQIFDPSKPSLPLKNLSVAKHYGIFFTPPHIAEIMHSRLMRGSKGKRMLIDPCLGSGVLLATPLLFSKKCTYDQLIGVEQDSQIAAWARMLLARIAELTQYKGCISIFQGDGLEYLLKETINSTKANIIINPPYGRLRVTKDRATNAETALTDLHSNSESLITELHSSVTDKAKYLRSKYPIFFDERGILEYSRLFFRACAEIAKSGASVSIISPDSWMSGSEGSALRKFLVDNRLIEEILLIREDSGKFSTVNQSTSVTLLSSHQREVFAIADFNKSISLERTIEYERLKSLAREDLAIPRVSGIQSNTFERLSILTKFSAIEWIVNARGEVDQTGLKCLFKKEATKIPLVRGEHVERFSFKHSSSEIKPSYLDFEGFLDYISTKPKRNHFEMRRLVGRQCSYAQQPRRLIFCQVPAKHAIGNSCNYISVTGTNDEEIQQRLYLLLGILNSVVLDWYFRIENSNNHVGNYEIDNFPFPVDAKWFPLVSSIAYQLEKSSHDVNVELRNWLLDLLEASVALAYGLDLDLEFQMMLDKIGGCNVLRSMNFARHLQRKIKFPERKFGDEFFNHSDPTLSELDRLIISHVPEGGNWQNIPETVPSDRLKQIREMSAERGVVRTTYYGRLRRDQPAYTINTYFNRPGNGTHIHPVLDRTLTSREAARLQSFPDNYLFLGSEGAIRDQIGNAVPPLLARAIGQKYIGNATSNLCVDVFCGAGGLSLGLESAGWEVLAAIDNNREALDTYCFNRPCDLEPTNHRERHTSVYKRDLHDKGDFENVIMHIKDGLKGRILDMLVGGPPCQGFSHAGFRLSNDKRNDLASIYLHFAERLRPRIFILENVEGLATFSKGQVLSDIVATLRQMGYRVNDPVWKLSSEQYGAPQMRKRVFVVATMDSSLDLTPPSPMFKRCAGRREGKASQNLFDANLPTPHTVADALAGLSLPSQVAGMLSKWLKGSVID